MSGIDYVKSRFTEKWESLMREGRAAHRNGVLREQSPYAPGDEFSLPWALGWDAEHEKAKERAVERVKELESAIAAERARAEAAEARAARVDEYASYYAAAWEAFEADSDGPEPLCFAEWLAQQCEVQS